MKRILLLIIMSLALQANAQYGRESIYDLPEPGKLPINIKLQLPNNLMMSLELMNSAQLDSLGDIDSLLHKLWTDITAATGWPGKSMVSRRVDYIASATNSSFRIIEHTSSGSVYAYRNGTLSQSKLSRDTIRIRLRRPGQIAGDKAFHPPFFLMFTLDQLEDITTISPTSIATALAMVKAANIAPAAAYTHRSYHSTFDVSTQQWEKLSGISKKTRRLFVEPDLYVAFQYVRGAWVPSAAAGLQLINGEYEGKKNVFKLMWEPHFIFSRNGTGALTTDRNDFITFRYMHYESSSSNDFTSPLSFSIGYLLSRNGSWYEANTIKFSVPGVHYKDLSLEPEFFFNSLLRNFSPSLKLNYNID